MDRNVISRISLEAFLSDSTEKVSRGTLVFQKISGLKNCIRWCITILSKNDFLTVPKIFVGEPFVFQKFFLSKKFMDRKGISRFSLEIFCLTVPKKFPERSLLFQKTSGLEKLHRMVYHDFVKKWFSHSSEKFRRRTLHFSENLLYRKRFRIGGGYHDFLSKHFVSQYRKNS